MEWEPEQELGGLGFAGICRETYRVGIRASLLHTKGGLGAAILSALLLVHAATLDAVVSRLDTGDSSDIVHLVVGFGLCSLLEIVYLCVVLLLSFGCTAAYVFCVASLYCTDGEPGHTDRIIRDIPRAPLARLVRMITRVVLFAILYIAFAVLIWLVIVDLDASDDEVVVRPLQVLGGTACLASASYVAVLSHTACVVALLEDADLFGAVRKSRALLAGKLWAASAVFVPLDGCFIAMQISFMQLVLHDALGLGIWFQVAAGAAIAVALWAVVVLTLVAQPVVYLV
ncbi:hypothetical protein ACQ4PT_010225 [Festuca glaucescens]